MPHRRIKKEKTMKNRTMPEVLSIPRLVRNLGRAVQRDPGRARRIVGTAIEDVSIQLRVRHELRTAGFRPSRVLRGSDHPDPHPPAPPKAAPAPAPASEREAVAA
jgi:hypothetical protein